MDGPLPIDIASLAEQPVDDGQNCISFYGEMFHLGCKLMLIEIDVPYCSDLVLRECVSNHF